MRVLTTLFLVFAVIVLHAQGLKVRGKTIVDRRGNEVILRGFGLGGWMLQEPYMLQLSGAASTQGDIQQKIKALIGAEKTESFYTAWLNNHCTKADIDSLAAWGFNSVRLPMHYNLYTPPVENETDGKITWLEKGFAMTDSLLNWCKANKIYLILDLHAAPGGQGNDMAIADRDTTKPYLWTSERNKQKTIALWEKMAARYAKEEWLGAYDLINEPNYGFENTADKNGCAESKNLPLRQLQMDITAAIRKVDKEHIIIIEGNCWGNNYNGIFPLWDSNLVVSFHKYWNYTDQGSIQNFLDIREKHNVPIWCGETGENSNVWFTDVIELFERNKIGWAMWPMKKMGINNPLQVRINPGYQKLIDYWRGKAEKPAAEVAEKSLMQLTEDIRINNNIYRRDVVDAMMRQVQTTEVLPFKDFRVPAGRILFAADYDLGRNGYAYLDKDTGNYWVSTTRRTDWNRGRQYRNDAVDITECKDTVTNGFAVGWIEDGEWLQYSIYNDREARYDLFLRTSAKDSQGQVQVTIDNLSLSEITLPQTNSARPWTTTRVGNIKLSKGVHQIRIHAKKGGFDLNYLQFTPSK